MFQQLLNETLEQVDGSVACVLMGFDGLPVDIARRGSADLDESTLGTELAGHISGLARTLGSLNVGPLAELSFQTGNLWATVRVLNDDYFLVLLLEPGANLGRGRYLLRTLAPRVRQEF